jgi:hypothetical protein
MSYDRFMVLWKDKYNDSELLAGSDSVSFLSFSIASILPIVLPYPLVFILYIRIHF